ncbi:MAG: hypothetical protein HY363_03820 [Candidatus Aenigmarchaeota archaeon]|nr:hypothetical protein [Candidatus Aenigmarchaeota archaeon]
MLKNFKDTFTSLGFCILSVALLFGGLWLSEMAKALQLNAETFSEYLQMVMIILAVIIAVFSVVIAVLGPILVTGTTCATIWFFISDCIKYFKNRTPRPNHSGGEQW